MKYIDLYFTVQANIKTYSAHTHMHTLRYTRKYKCKMVWNKNHRDFRVKGRKSVLLKSTSFVIMCMYTKVQLSDESEDRGIL